MSIQALREQRAAKAKELQELVNNTAWDNTRDQPIYDAGIAAIEDIDARIERHQKMNDLAADFHAWHAGWGWWSGFAGRC